MRALERVSASCVLARARAFVWSRALFGLCCEVLATADKKAGGEAHEARRAWLRARACAVTSAPVFVRVSAEPCARSMACARTVLYAGAETKVGQNSVQPRFKASSFERATDRYVLLVLFVLLLLATFCLALSHILHANIRADGLLHPHSHAAGAMLDTIAARKLGSYWYMPANYAYQADGTLRSMFEQWLSFLLLFSSIWPISLYLAVESCKVAQARRAAQRTSSRASCTLPRF
eukprot:6209714-Pleurochrysis_carterae.AAC.2